MEKLFRRKSSRLSTTLTSCHLQYAMALADPMVITLLQPGMSLNVCVLGNVMEIFRLFGSGSLGACLDNYLDAVDGSFYTFQGGDVPNQANFKFAPFPLT